MRLSEKIKLVKDVLNAVAKIEFEEIQQANRTYVRYFNLTPFLIALKDLRLAETFKSYRERIANQNYFNTGNEYVVDAGHTPTIRLLLAEIAQTATDILNFGLEYQVSSPAETVYVKLPPTESLDTISKDLHTFQIILSQTLVNDEIAGDIRILGVEEGSVWVKVYVGGMVAVTLLGNICWSAAVVVKKWHEADYMKSLADSKALDVQERKTLLDAHSLMLKAVVSAETNYIANHHLPDSLRDDAEYIGRLKASMQMLAEEFHKGAEVSPALAAPEDVKNLFPDMKQLPSIESKIKQIADKQ